MTEKCGIEIKNGQDQDLSPHQVYADSNGILWPGMLPRHLLSLEPFFPGDWALDGVSSPSPFGAFNGRRTCLLL